VTIEEGSATIKEERNPKAATIEEGRYHKLCEN
jgi:hypothetical protein